MDTNREEKDMRKQYTFHEYAWGCYVIELYHDGVMTQTIKKDRADVDKYIDKLESQGYTVGYTEHEVLEARKRWEHIYENRIEPKGDK